MNDKTKTYQIVSRLSMDDCASPERLGEEEQQALAQAAEDLYLFNVDRGPKPSFDPVARTNVSIYCEAIMARKVGLSGSSDAASIRRSRSQPSRASTCP